MKFSKAERRKSKLRLGLTGPSGSGKTTAALLIAKAFGLRTAVIDSEKGSASLYSHIMDFDVLELGAPYSPERYVEAIHTAESAGYEVLVIDSATHEWNGTGGCLELVDQLAASRFKGNTWSAWSEVTPRHRAFVDAIVQSPLHVIVTMRSKTETAQTDEGGRKKVVKLGMKAEQRDGIEYELTTVLDLAHESHYATATKDRTGLFTGKDPQRLSEQTGAALVEWLASGAEPAEPEAGQEPAGPDLSIHLTAINGATSLGALKKAWEAGKAAAGEDTEARMRIKASGDARMAVLRAMEEPATNGVRS